MKSFLGNMFRRNTKTSRNQLSRRTLRFEPLENRQLLSVVTLTPVQDNSLIAYKATTAPYSGGQDPSLYVGLEHQTGTAMRALIDFNLAAAGIPAGSTINSVTLSVYVNKNDLGGTASSLVQLRDVLANWGEGTSAGDPGGMPPFVRATNGDATWLDSVYNTNPSLATLWTNAGGDFSPTTSGTATLLSDGTTALFSSTSQMITDVQNWLNNPSTNFGWLLLGVETPGVKSGRMIDSSEGANPPTLTINYTVPTATNLPPTLAAIANPAAILENAGLQTVNLTGISAGAGETQALSVTATSSNTALIPNPTVTYTSPSATGSLSFQPVANQYGTATVTATVRDAGLDGILNNADDGTVTQTFTVTVNHVNQLPTLAAIANPAAINENAGLQTVNLAGISAGPGDSQTLAVTATSSNTALIPNPTVTYTSPNATGSLSYQPVANQFGTATITVTVRDAGLDGILNNTDDGTVTQTFTVTVNHVNQLPTLAAIANPPAINENAGLQTVNLAGISAGPGDSQTLAVTATSSNTALIPNPTVTYTSPNATGSLSYQPVANQYGTATVTVTVRDAGLDGILNNTDDGTVMQTFTVVVNGVNQLPTLAAIANPPAINENAGLQTVNLAGISAGLGDSQTLAVTATSSNTALIPNPTVTYTSPNATGSLSYQPVANQFGTATVTVTVRDAGLDGILNNTDDGIATRTFTVAVNQVVQTNQPPTLAAIAALAINENAGAQTVNLTGISAGAGETQALSVTATSSNTALIPNPTVTYTSPNATGSLAFQPVANQFGTATVTVTVRDAGLDGILNNADDGTATQTFTVTVNHVNQLPTLAAIANPPAILENAVAQTVNLTGISAGPGDSQTLAVTATSSNTALIPNPTVTYTSPNATGTLSYQPVANQYGTATITVTVRDAGLDGILNNTDDGIATQTFTVAVNQVVQTNLPPTLAAIANPAAINENAGLQTVNLTGISAGPGDSQALLVTAVSDNTALLANPTVTYTSPNSTGSLSYQPVANQYGTAHVTVTVRDAGLDGILNNTDDGTVAQTFTVLVNQVNQIPTLAAIANPAAINENAGLQTVNLTGISAGPGDSQALLVTAVSDNTALLANPTVTYTSPNSTGSLSYQPVANQYGTAHVTVTVRDAGVDGILGNTDDATVTQTFTVTVNQVNQLPTLAAIANPAAILENAGLQTVNLTGISAGTGESQQLQVTATSDNTALLANPTVTYTSPNSTGSLSYQPVANQFGTAHVTVTVRDAGVDGIFGNTDDATVTRTFTVSVNQVTLPPTVTIDQTGSQADPSSSSPIHFTVVFSEPVTGFVTGDVTLGGTAGATTAVVTGSGASYDVAVSGMTTSGSVVATIAAGVTHDAAGNLNLASTSTDNTVAFTMPTSSGPTIDKVVVVLQGSSSVITWHVTDTGSIKSSSITMDGRPVTRVYGPYGSRHDANYAAAIGALSAGTHNYVITATDMNGVATTYADTCTVINTSSSPTIRNVVVALDRSVPIITWNVMDTAGIRSSSITVDGKPVNRVYGPYGTKYDANYAGMIGRLSPGSHNYVITATGADGVVKTYTGTFTVARSGGSNRGDDGGSDDGDDGGSTGSISHDSATVKTNWLVDYASVAASVHASKSNVDAVFADY